MGEVVDFPGRAPEPVAAGNTWREVAFDPRPHPRDPIAVAAWFVRQGASPEDAWRYAVARQLAWLHDSRDTWRRFALMLVGHAAVLALILAWGRS